MELGSRVGSPARKSVKVDVQNETRDALMAAEVKRVSQAVDDKISKMRTRRTALSLQGGKGGSDRWDATSVMHSEEAAAEVTKLAKRRSGARRSTNRSFVDDTLRSPIPIAAVKTAVNLLVTEIAGLETLVETMAERGDFDGVAGAASTVTRCDSGSSNSSNSNSGIDENDKAASKEEEEQASSFTAQTDSLSTSSFTAPQVLPVRAQLVSKQRQLVAYEMVLADAAADLALSVEEEKRQTGKIKLSLLECQAAIQRLHVTQW